MEASYNPILDVYEIPITVYVRGGLAKSILAATGNTGKGPDDLTKSLAPALVSAVPQFLIQGYAQAWMQRFGQTLGFETDEQLIEHLGKKGFADGGITVKLPEEASSKDEELAEVIPIRMAPSAEERELEEQQKKNDREKLIRQLEEEVQKNPTTAAGKLAKKRLDSIRGAN